MIRRVLLAMLGTAIGWVFAGSAQSGVFQDQSALELYQRALVEEQAVGNLPEAITLYTRAAESAGNNRELAAHALVHAAGAYEKLAEPEAARLYAEVIGTYPEQTEWVTVAEARLEALGQGQPAQVRSGRTDVSAVVDPVISTYCISCHNQGSPTAGLALDAINTRDVGENPERWEAVLRRLRSRTMPPAGMARPDAGTHQLLISTLELALDQAYPSVNNRERVTDPELASRMARLIWGGDPDAVLMEIAARSRLRDPATLEQQVRRMLEDPRSLGLVTDFFESWLWPLGNLDRLDLDPARYPSFGDPLVQAFSRETRLFLASQLREDRPAMEMWTADYTFLDERLARHYGVGGVTGNQFRRVTLPDSSRGGLLGHGSLLAATGVDNRTSPTVRGRMVLMNFFGQSPPDPPAGVSPMPADDRPLRIRLEAHLVNPRCSGCHRIFEPLGISLENFDAVGRWRTTDQGAPIDASGAFVDGTSFNGPVEFRAALTGYRDAFVTHATESLFAHALGRALPGGAPYPYEMPAVRAIVREAAPTDYRWASIILGIVKSEPFQMREVVP